MIKIKDVMTSIDNPESIISVDVNDKIDTALKKFLVSGKNRIIVKQNKIPIKILRPSDVVSAKPTIKIMKILDHLDPINSASPDDDIQKVISMQDHQPVTIVFDKTSNPIGIITPSDIIRHVKEVKQSEQST